VEDVLDAGSSVEGCCEASAGNGFDADESVDVGALVFGA